MRKILKKRPRFGVQKLTRFGVRLRVRILFFNISVKNKPQNRSIFYTPKTGAFFQYFCAFWRNLLRYFPLVFATDVVFLHACWLKPLQALCWSPVNNNSTAPCRRGTVEAILYGPVRQPKFNPQKRGPNSDRCLRDSFLRSHAQTAKANATYQN